MTHGVRPLGLPRSGPPLSWRAEGARKAIHLSLAVLPVGWGLGWLGRPTILTALVAGLAVAAAVEVGRRRAGMVRDTFDHWVGWMLRAHEAIALTGATWILLAMTAAVWVLPAPAALAALWAAAVGDATAAIVGRAAGARGAVPSGAAPGAKTWAGSLACAAASAVGPLILVGTTVPVALTIGAAAAAAERPRWRLDDNVRVTAAAGLAAWALLRG